MRGVVVTEFGGPEVLELQDVPEPAPGPGPLLVDVEAIGVNYREHLRARRELRRHGAADRRSRGLRDGRRDRRAGRLAAAPGSYAERVVVDEAKAVPVPEGVSPEIGAAALLQGMTAHYLACSTYTVGPGDTAVVHAAAGGVGLLLTQIVKLHGGTVIGTTSSEEKAELARTAGADHVIGYEGFADQVRELTGGEGASVVYDGIGRATFAESLRALRPRGLVAVYGAASGPPEALELGQLAANGSLFVTRPTLPSYTRTREELLERAGDVFAWHAAGKLDFRIGGRYPLEQARQAQEDLASRKTTGKLVILPGL